MTMPRTTPTGRDRAHAAVRAYALRHRLDPAAFRSDGRVMLDVDGKCRVMVQPAADNRIALTTRLVNLDTLPREAREPVLLRLATLATGTLREHAPGLCVDEEEQALLLQAQLPATTDAEQLEAQLAQFVNVWAFWRHACLQETGRIEPSGRR